MPLPNGLFSLRGAAGLLQQELLSAEPLHHPMESDDLTRCGDFFRSEEHLGRDDASCSSFWASGGSVLVFNVEGLHRIVFF